MRRKKDTTKKNRQPTNPTDFGWLMNELRTDPSRSKKRLSLRALAKEVDVSHAYLSALETGREAKPSKKVLEDIIRALDLKPQDGDLLRHAAERGEVEGLIAPGVVVDVDRSINRQNKDDVAEVWIVAERPLEMEDMWLRHVVANIKERHVRYVYFVRYPYVWDTLRRKLAKELGKHILMQHVTCISVSESFLVPFLFKPSFGLIHLKGGGVVGVWAFRAPFEQPITARIVRVLEMEPHTAGSLRDLLGHVVDAARAGASFQDQAPPIRFDVLPIEEGDENAN